MLLIPTEKTTTISTTTMIDSMSEWCLLKPGASLVRLKDRKACCGNNNEVGLQRSMKMRIGALAGIHLGTVLTVGMTDSVTEGPLTPEVLTMATATTTPGMIESGVGGLHLSLKRERYRKKSGESSDTISNIIPATQ
jgi:hypothetical protein